MKVQVFLLLLANVLVVIKAAAIQENRIEDTDEDGDVDIDKKCPPWDKWQSSKCLWPSQQFSSLPKACTSLPKKPKIPDIIKQFIQSKQLEIYSVVQQLFKLRGADSACGYCSRKIRCRQRQGGQWQQGCQFAQAQIVNEECEGTKACEIKPILGACPPPVPLPPPRRKPKPHDQPDDIGLQSVNRNGLGDQNLEIGADKNSTQGPPFWHCARNKDGSKCFCCCGWYLPDASSGKCVKIKKEDGSDDPLEDQIWNWSGLMDLDVQNPFDADSVIGDQLTEQIEPPPMEIAPEGDMGGADGEPEDQLPNPPAMDPLDATVHQVRAPVTDSASDKKPVKKVKHEENEI